jgi:hypothetical protein
MSISENVSPRSSLADEDEDLFISDIEFEQISSSKFSELKQLFSLLVEDGSLSKPRPRSKEALLQRLQDLHNGDEGGISRAVFDKWAGPDDAAERDVWAELAKTNDAVKAQGAQLDEITSLLRALQPQPPTQPPSSLPPSFPSSSARIARHEGSVDSDDRASSQGLAGRGLVFEFPEGSEWKDMYFEAPLTSVLPKPAFRDLQRMVGRLADFPTSPPLIDSPFNASLSSERNVKLSEIDANLRQIGKALLLAQHAAAHVAAEAEEQQVDTDLSTLIGLLSTAIANAQGIVSQQRRDNLYHGFRSGHSKLSRKEPLTEGWYTAASLRDTISRAKEAVDDMRDAYDAPTISKMLGIANRRPGAKEQSRSSYLRPISSSTSSSGRTGFSGRSNRPSYSTTGGDSRPSTFFQAGDARRGRDRSSRPPRSSSFSRASKPGSERGPGKQ